MSVIKKNTVPEHLKTATPLLTKDIGGGAKILVLTPVRDGHCTVCLERNGRRMNFSNSKVQDGHGNYKFIRKQDGFHPNGVPFYRTINLKELPECGDVPSYRTAAHKRVRTADEVIR